MLICMPQKKYVGLVITLGYIFAYFWARSRTFYLVCLDAVRTDTLGHNNKTKDRLKGCNGSPNEYDTLDDLLTQTNKANKAAIELQKHLSPNSVFRKRCDRKELRKMA